MFFVDTPRQCYFDILKMDSKQLTTLASGILAGAAAATAIYYATNSKSNTNTVRVGVSCILLDPLTGKYVLGLRKHKEGKGMGSESWHNPGGKTEVGEALETTCCRELFEETGIVLNPSSCYQIGTTNDIMTKKDGTFQHYVTVHYLCEWNETIAGGNQPQLTEPTKCYGWSWITFDDIYDLHQRSKLFLPLSNLLHQPTFKIPIGSRQLRLQRHSFGKIIFFIGYPGSGKGTQGKIISKQLKLRHVSTGELFRAEVKTGSSIGKQFDNYMQKGEIIPEDLTFNYLRHEFSKEKYNQGFVLDGYPKDKGCYEFIINYFNETNRTMVGAVYFDVSRLEVHKRLTGRLLCKNCERNYHKYIKAVQPIVNNTCDVCSGALSSRSDDAPAVIDRRLDSYDQKTMPNVFAFENDDLLIKIDASQSPSSVNREILHKLEETLCPPRTSYFLNWKDRKKGLVKNKHKRVSTKWHNHMDAESDVLLHQMIQTVDVKFNEKRQSTRAKGYTIAQNKIYPISHLVLGPQTTCNEFDCVYRRLPNFHPINQATDEAFSTGAMGEQGIDYDFAVATLETCQLHASNGKKNIMTEIEEDLFEIESTGLNNENNKIGRDDGDSTTQIDWNKLSGWKNKMINNVPAYELHHAIDLPKTSTDGNLPPVHVQSLSDAMHKDDRFDMCTGGWFVFEKEDRWAYRSNEFSNQKYNKCKELLLQQYKHVRIVFNELLAKKTNGEEMKSRGIKTAASLEKVHAIWRF